MSRLLKPTRRKLILGGASLLAIPTILWAQVPMTGAGLGAPSGGAAPTFTGTDAKYQSSAGFPTTYTFTGVNVTTGFVMVFAFGYMGGFSTDFSAVSVNGTSLTQATSLGNSTFPCGLWYGTVTGGSVSIVLTSGHVNSIQAVGFSIGTATGISGAPSSTSILNNVTGTGSNLTFASSVTIPSSGMAIAGVFAGTPTAISWVNMTNAPGGNLTSGSNQVNMAYKTLAGAFTPTIGSANGPAYDGVCAAWGP